ncbi:MAG: glutaminase [Cyanobacteria bacterium]|nr:glutaminase [Cyanobacteriota bacterium]MDA1021211.1 glutaminase [Cyanobacteriota bacterium]
MNYQTILEEIQNEIQPLIGQGKVANYIPALAAIPITKFGMALKTIENKEYSVGDAKERFSIQSISKIFSFALAIKELGDELWIRVGKEPSGTAFNSLVQLEFEKGIPRNPFINAGALVMTDILTSSYDDPKQTLLDIVRDLADNPDIDFDEVVAQSENEWGDRNRALAYFIKDFGNINNSVNEVLDLYFHQCSLSMSSLDLVRAFSCLANAGKTVGTNKTIISERQTKRINSLLMTCGTYDAVGDFAYRVGLPGKSGVGGGIIAIMPGHFVLSVWSPGLNETGNSLVGTKALELFTTKTKTSIF